MAAAAAAAVAAAALAEAEGDEEETPWDTPGGTAGFSVESGAEDAAPIKIRSGD